MPAAQLREKEGCSRIRKEFRSKREKELFLQFETIRIEFNTKVSIK